MVTAGWDVSLDTGFDVLSAEPRRKLLMSLMIDSPPDAGPLSVSDADDAPSLYHAHLPKLASHDFVDWDREAQTVTRGRNIDAARPFLDVVDERDDIAGAN